MILSPGHIWQGLGKFFALTGGRGGRSTSILWLEARYAARHATLAWGSPLTTEVIQSKRVIVLMLRNPVNTSGAAPVWLEVPWALLGRDSS